MQRHALGFEPTPSTSAPCRHARAAAPSTCRARRSCVKVTAFRATAEELQTVARQFPTPFNIESISAGSNGSTGTIAPLSPNMRFHSSVWYHDHLCDGDDECLASPGLLIGQDEYSAAIDCFHAAYAPSQSKTIKLWSAVADNCEHVFFLFVTKIQNTGPHVGQKATYTTSTVHGMYHLLLDDGGKVDEAWCFRGPTAEERRGLLKKPPSEPVWPIILNLHHCSWKCDEQYLAKIRKASQEWISDVQGKACTQALARLAHDDVVVYEGSGLYSTDPMEGRMAVEGDMLVRRHTWNFIRTEVLAIAAQDNRAFIHWNQVLTHRKTGQGSEIEGTSMLVFDQRGKVVQVLDYTTPSQLDRELLFKAIPKRYKEPQLVGAAGPNGLSAEAMEALARQEQEWICF